MGNRLNSQIREKEVRLVDLPDGYNNGVYKIEEALKIARDLELDLIEISNKVQPVVCKIMEYSKFKYQQKKKEKDIKKKPSILKELKFSPEIADNDLNIKAKKASEFLKDGNKVKVTVEFRGRSIMFKDRGKMALLRLSEIVKDDGVSESMPEMLGKKMFFIIKPKKQS